jgi:S1-C subfamily serine protease
VVQGCQSITVRTKQGDRAAQLVASDEKRDLAILRTQATPPAIAPLRWNISDLRLGDTLFMYGFPGEAGAGGTPTFVRTSLSAIHGPGGQAEWLQMQAPTQQGNSGGPVLDSSGNVIAVIFGRAEIYETARNNSSTPPKLIGKSGVAITLAELRSFLTQHMAGYYESSSGMVSHADPVIASNAAKFTFPVLCVQGTITR